MCELEGVRLCCVLKQIAVLAGVETSAMHICKLPNYLAPVQ